MRWGLLAVLAGCASYDTELEWSDTDEWEWELDGLENRVEGAYLAEYQVVDRVGSSWTVEGVTAAAALGVLTPEVMAAREEISPRCELYEGVQRWTSLEGVSPVSLQAGPLDVTATWDEDQYSLDGVEAAELYGEGGHLVVSHGGEERKRVGAPAPLGAPGEFLGPPAGLSTRVLLDVPFDALLVSARAEGDAGPVVAYCLWELRHMEVDGERYATPLFDEEAITALAERGVEEADVTAASINAAFDESLFPGVRPVLIKPGRGVWFRLGIL